MAYTSEEIEIILTRLEKVHTRQKICEEDYLMLTPPSKKFFNKENIYLRTSESKYSKYGKLALKTESSEHFTSKDRM